MQIDEKQKSLTNLISELEELAKPIDFIDFIEKGILTKSGDWYYVQDFSRLPDYARLKIEKAANDSNGVKVKFTKSSKFEKLLNKMKNGK